MLIDTFDDVLCLLDKLGLFHMDFSLHRMEAALDALSLQHVPCPVVQIVGTNGKGSTATFLASLAREHGLRVGLYTSPHMLTFRERVCIDGCMLPLDTWVACVRKVHAVAPDLTYFELLTLVGLVAFAEANVDLMIFEAGLGGRYDATTAIAVDLVCFTPIHVDHEKILGTTETAIATEKSYAMREGKPVLTAVQKPDVLRVLREVAEARGCVYQEIHPLTQYALGMRGVHQQTNAGLALAAFRLLCENHAFEYKEIAVKQALRTASIVGRMQWIKPTSKDDVLSVPLLLDGAHNLHGLEALLVAVEALSEKPAAMIFSCLSDKNLEEILPRIMALSAACGNIPIFVPTIMDNERAMIADDLANLLAPRAIACARMSTALREAMAFATQSNDALGNGARGDGAKRPVLVCGSLYLLAEFFILYPQYMSMNSGVVV